MDDVLRPYLYIFSYRISYNKLVWFNLLTFKNLWNNLKYILEQKLSSNYTEIKTTRNRNERRGVDK